MMCKVNSAGFFSVQLREADASDKVLTLANKW